MLTYHKSEHYLLNQSLPLNSDALNILAFGNSLPATTLADALLSEYTITLVG